MTCNAKIALICVLTTIEGVEMSKQHNQKSGNSQSSGVKISELLITKDHNPQTPRQNVFSFLQTFSNRLFDLAGGLAALFTIIDMCLVWYGAFYLGGSITVGDTLFVLQLEFLLVGPLALTWILAKFKGWV